MTRKGYFGTTCEELVRERIEKLTRGKAVNLNDLHHNHPVTDLEVTTPGGQRYQVSVKGKAKPKWPAVKGIVTNDQYIVFVDCADVGDIGFYILSCRQWQAVLERILPERDKGAKIVKGALEWRWVDKGGKKKWRGSWLLPDEIKRYKDKWSTLPGVRARG